MDSICRTDMPISRSIPVSLGAGMNPTASPSAVGQAFESMFASILIKQMRQTLDGESMFGKDPGDVLGGMFDHFLGEQLGRAGGLGVGRMIRAQLERRSAST